MKRVIIFGGYGVFGSHIARALVRWGVPVTIAGRDLAKARRLASSLGDRAQTIAADLSRAESCRAALEGHGVAINAAGPFQTFDATLLESCLEAGCHYADIADDRAYVARVRTFHEAFAARNLAAVFGCSSLPGISGALASLLREGAEEPVVRARVTMFIGSGNAKGQAALRSFLLGLGKPIAAPQGTILGFGDREVVALPLSFGRRAVFNFESPDYDLLPALLATPSVSVKVGFESRLATYAFATIAKFRLGGFARRWPGLFDWPGRLVGLVGSTGGAILVEIFFHDGTVRRASLVSATDGQGMAAMPCALVARALVQDESIKKGATTAYEFLGTRRALELLRQEGYELHGLPRRDYAST